MRRGTTNVLAGGGFIQQQEYNQVLNRKGISDEFKKILSGRQQFHKIIKEIKHIRHEHNAAHLQESPLAMFLFDLGAEVARGSEKQRDSKRRESPNILSRPSRKSAVREKNTEHCPKSDNVHPFISQLPIAHGCSFPL